MADSDKNIKITPNIGQASSLPTIDFVGKNNVPLYLKVLDANDIEFQTSTSSPLFKISQLTTGNVFTITEQSGVPLLNVNTTTGISLAPFLGNISIGQTNATWKLDIKGPSETTSFLGSAAGGTNQRLGVMIRGGSGSDSGRLAGIDFNAYYASSDLASSLGYNFPHARIACRSTGSGSFLEMGTSDSYAGGITNKSFVMDYEGRVAFTANHDNNNVFNDPDSCFVVNTHGTTSDKRTVVIKSYNQASISMGSYPSTWSPALMIQNPSNNGWLWLCALESGYNARIVTGGKGLDFLVNAPASSSGSGNAILSLNTESYGGGNAHAHIFGPLKQQATYTNGRHYSAYTYQSGAGGAYYIHMKTNIPWFNSFVMFNIQATGYAYGNSQYIDCRWTGYTYYTSGLISVSYNNVTSGMSANTMYQSSDGYLVLVGYSTGHYYIGFTLDAGFYCPTPGGYDFRITGGTYSSSQTGVY